MRKFINIIMSVLGTIFIGLGILGVFIPLLPTTPFLLLGAACYLRGSKKLYDRLISNKYLGKYILNYFEGKGIPLRTKVISISLVTITIGYTAIFIIENLALKIILFLIAVGVLVHLLSLKTLKNDK